MRNSFRFGVALIFAMGVLLAPSARCLAADKSKADEEAAAEKVEKELALSPEQKDKLKALREDLRAKQVAITNDLRAAKGSLQKELESPTPDRKRADSLVADINKLQSQMLSLRVEQVFSMRAILTPEQYQTLLKAREKRRQDMKTRVQQGGSAKTLPKAKPGK
jgi:Spy/CpxP family protein refolding chaperone